MEKEDRDEKKFLHLGGRANGRIKCSTRGLRGPKDLRHCQSRPVQKWNKKKPQLQARLHPLFPLQHCKVSSSLLALLARVLMIWCWKWPDNWRMNVLNWDTCRNIPTAYEWWAAENIWVFVDTLITACPMSCIAPSQCVSTSWALVQLTRINNRCFGIPNIFLFKSQLTLQIAITKHFAKIYLNITNRVRCIFTSQ